MFTISMRSLAILFTILLLTSGWTAFSPAAATATPITCYALAGVGGQVLTAIAAQDFDPATNETTLTTVDSSPPATGLAVRPGDNQSFVVVRNRLGLLDAATGVITLLPNSLDAGEGDLGSQTINGVQSLVFAPLTGVLYASAQVTGATVLIQIDAATGALVQNAFGAGVDYAVLPPVGDGAEIVAIAISPVDGDMLGLAVKGNASLLAQIDKATGATTAIGPAGVEDLAGLSFFAEGQLFASGANALYEVDVITGAALYPRTLDNAAGYSALSCLLPAANVITGRVFDDKNADKQFQPADGESGSQGVMVRLWRETAANGVPDASDALVASQTSDADGMYTFTLAATGDFLVDVEVASLPRRHALTTTNVQAASFAGFGLSDAGNDFGHVKQLARDDEVLVKFVAGTTPAAIDDLLARYDLLVKRHNGTLNLYTLLTPPGEAETLEEALNAEPIVQWAELNYLVKIADVLPDDPDFNNPTLVYAPQLIHAPAAWEVTTGSPSVVVAVIDTGVAPAHPEFSGRLVAGRNFAVTPDTDNAADDHGHGTHVAGILAAAIDHQGMVGIAPNVSIMPVKVIASDGYGTWDDIKEGIVWAVDHGARIVNLSLGAPSTSNALREAVEYAAAHGVLMVAAAGNAGMNEQFYPAYYPETLAVAATNASEQPWYLSNYGPTIDVAAPGEGIWSTLWTAGNPNTYGFNDGTSMAAPHVSGLAALLLSACPNYTAADLRGLIQANGVDLGAAGWDPVYGYGRIDAGATMAARANCQPLTPTPTATPTATPTPTATSTPTETPTPTPTPVYYMQRANSGGSFYIDGQGDLWDADQLFDGFWGATGGLAKSSTAVVNNTTDDGLYQYWRQAPGEYKFVAPNGYYEITLRFAEFEVSKAGDRVMRITIEDVVVENTLSIYGAVGRYAALDKVYSNIQLTDGTLNIQFAQNGGSKAPVVSAIRVRQTPGPTPTPTPTATPTVCLTCPTATPTPTPTPPPFAPIRVNSGGKAYTDSLGQVWSADQGYIGGGAKSTSKAVNGTVDDRLFQKWRSDVKEYRFTVPNGAYQVTLRFAEFERSKVGERVMNISLEGVVVASSLDVFALVGKETALDQVYTTTVGDGVLNIVFAKVGASTHPMINAIQVIRQ